MAIGYRKAGTEDAEMLINIYNASFYSDYMRYSECPGYGKTIEMMEASIYVLLKECADHFSTLSFYSSSLIFRVSETTCASVVLFSSFSRAI